MANVVCGNKYNRTVVAKYLSVDEDQTSAVLDTPATIAVGLQETTFVGKSKVVIGNLGSVGQIG